MGHLGSQAPQIQDKQGPAETQPCPAFRSRAHSNTHSPRAQLHARPPLIELVRDTAWGDSGPGAQGQANWGGGGLPSSLCGERGGPQ